MHDSLMQKTLLVQQINDEKVRTQTRLIQMAECQIRPDILTLYTNLPSLFPSYAYSLGRQGGIQSMFNAEDVGVGHLCDN